MAFPTLQKFVDKIGPVISAAWLNGVDAFMSNLGYNQQTQAEITAGVTPTSFWYPELDVRRYGALFNGVSNDSAAFVAAFAVASQYATAVVTMPAGTSLNNSTVTVPQNVKLKGVGLVPGNGTQSNPGATVLLFPNSLANNATTGVPTGVLLEGFVSPNGLKVGCAEGFMVLMQGTPSAGSVGVYCDRGQYNILTQVYVRNWAVPYKLFASGPAGITAQFINCGADQATTNFIVMDGWPELYLTGGRYGSINEPAGVNAFIYATRTQTPTGGTGPNTLNCNGVQFNSAGQVAFLLEVDAINTPATSAPSEWTFTGCHVEGLNTAAFKCTSTIGTFFNRIRVASCVFNDSAIDLFAVNSAVGLNQCNFTNSLIAGTTTLTATGTAFHNRVGFSNCEFGGAVSVNGGTAGSNMTFTGGSFDAGATFSGLWSTLHVVGFVGAITDNTSQQSATSSIILDNGSGALRVGSSGLIGNEYIFANAGGLQHQHRTAQGAKGAAVISNTGDSAFFYEGYAFDGSVYGRIGSWRVQVTGTPGAGNLPGIHIWSVNTGAADQTDVLALDNSINFRGINDNQVNLGTTGQRWASVHSVTATFSGDVQVAGGSTAILHATTTVTSGAGSSAGTLTNAPAAGNPTKWIAFNDAGTTRFIPAW